MSRPVRTHPYGFGWGPFNVTRIASYTQGKRESNILGVETDHHKVEIYSSRTGRSVRVYIDGVEVGH